MRRLMIYHIVARPVWEAVPAGPYRADSLASEGFIHCSHLDQVARVANLYYATAPELVVLCVDAVQLAADVRDEDAGTGERFPHVYGPIEREAIVEVVPLQRDAEGRWQFG
jgi:uncharacterized protein (DUF952 family)